MIGILNDIISWAPQATYLSVHGGFQRYGEETFGLLRHAIATMDCVKTLHIRSDCWGLSLEEVIPEIIGLANLEELSLQGICLATLTGPDLILPEVRCE